VIVLDVTGKELKLILRIAESGSRGFCSVSGVRLRLVSPDEDPKGTDLNGDKRIDAWEVNRLLDVELDDGSPIIDDRHYKLATLDFLINGGDDLGWIMEQLPASRQAQPTGLLRDIVVQHLKTLAQAGPINPVDHPIIDPANPRLRFVKTKDKARSRKHHRRRHKKAS
jgi:2',3'-cyclic-nucleotide 2'-phosphodiesterase (5'-nucleotidase family)